MERIKVKNLPLKEDIIFKAKNVLKNGGVIALPTETVYGLVAGIFSVEGVNKVYGIKGRKQDKPLPILLPRIDSVYDYAEEVPEFAHKLINKFWPGPLTVIFKKKTGLNLPFDSVSLGFRIPDHPVPLSLLKTCGAVVSTSANISGGRDAVNAEDVVEYFGGEVDLVLDAGPSVLGIPSTVVDCSGSSPKIVREGKITYSDIKTTINKRS